MRDGFVLAESDLVDFLSGSTDSAINFSESADLHTPIHPPQYSILGATQPINFVTVRNGEVTTPDKIVTSCCALVNLWLIQL